MAPRRAALIGLACAGAALLWLAIQGLRGGGAAAVDSGGAPPPLAADAREAALVPVEGPERAAAAAAPTSDPRGDHAARLPEEATRPTVLSGRVVDSLGAPRAAHLVGLALHAAHAPIEPAEWLGLPHARTDASGVFRLEWDGAGDALLFVGFGGRAVLEDAAPRRFARGTHHRVDVCVAAPARLAVRVVTDAGGARAREVQSVSVYRRPGPADLARRSSIRPAPEPPDLGPKLDDRGLDEGAPDPERPAPIEADALGKRLRALRPSAAPRDGVLVASALTDAEGRAVFDDVPVGEPLAFATARGIEAFVVEGEVSLEPGRELAVTLALPPPYARDAAPPEALRRVFARVEPPAPPSGAQTVAPRELGVTWH